MYARLLRHEWRSLTADAALWMVLAAFAASIGYGTFNGVRWVAFQRAAIAQAQQEERQRFDKHEAEIARINRENATVSAFADPRNPDAVGRSLGARFAVLPPTPVAALAVGQSDLLPYYFRMTTDAKETVLAAAELENPHRLLVGRFDLAFVLIYLYPLLILALTYNLLSAEKEQGTLVLALTQSVSLRTLVTGKVAVRFGLFVAAVAVMTVLAITLGRIDLDASGVLMRLALWLAAIVLYGLFWFTVATAVAALGKPSATNAMIMAGVWLVLVILVPSIVSLTATTTYPVPSRVEMIQTMRVASDAANTEGSKLLAQYYEDHPELATADEQQAMNDFNMVRVAVNTEVERRVRPVLDRFTQQLTAQQRVVARARFLSPAILMQDALNDVAGTGTARHRAFISQVEDYHRRWREYFVPLVFQRARLHDYSRLPGFTFEEEAVSGVVQRVMVSLGGLAFPAAVLGGIAFVRMRRYPIVD
jgi:ABC-2 type transport system permease protein